MWDLGYWILGEGLWFQNEFKVMLSDWFVGGRRKRLILRCEDQNFQKTLR